MKKETISTKTNYIFKNSFTTFFATLKWNFHILESFQAKRNLRAFGPGCEAFIVTFLNTAICMLNMLNQSKFESPSKSNFPKFEAFIGLNCMIVFEKVL